MLTEVKNHIKLIFKSFKYNLMRQMTNSKSFMFSIVGMILNNGAMIVQWLVLFSLKSNIAGYTMDKVMILWAIASTSYGVAYVFFGGAFDIPLLIENGKLDQFLVQPKNVLIQVISSNLKISAIGDLIFGYLLLFIFFPSIENLILFTLFSIIAGIIFTSVYVIFSSICFYFLKSDGFADAILHIFLNCAMYPDTIFPKAIKYVLYTIIPVGVAVYLPVNLLTNFNITLLSVIILVTILIVILAFFCFNKGLKKYNSTNLMVARV